MYVRVYIIYICIYVCVCLIVCTYKLVSYLCVRTLILCLDTFLNHIDVHICV